MSLDDVGEIPAYCGVTEDEVEDRREQVRAMMAQAEDVEALEDGYRFTFLGDQDVLEQVVGFTLDERRCCPMGRFEVTFQGPGEPVTLTFRGPAPMKQDMREGLELDRWFDEVPA